MIVYKIDKQPHVSASTQIRDMDRVLVEISPSLQRLQELMYQHDAAISSPTIASYRDELQDLISEAIDLTQMIAVRTQKLINASEQAGKHLGSLEEHLAAVLRNKPIDSVMEAPAEVTKARI